jgi:peptidoglycan/xylan/chitin deacetylase (PgdA/CDA1 family)
MPGEAVMNDFIPILLYHISTARKSGVFDVAPWELWAHLEAIQAADRTPLVLTALAAGLRNRQSLPRRVVALTFDDATNETRIAVERLAGLGIPASVYVTIGEIGRPGMLPRAGIVEMSGLPGIEVGAHAFNHRRLDELAAAELLREVADSKAALEDLIQRPVTSFAYPHGSYNRRARDAVVAADYACAAAVKNALSHPADDPFALARWTVLKGTSVPRISQVLAGVGVPIAWHRERGRTRIYRAARRIRRRVIRNRFRERSTSS